MRYLGLLAVVLTLLLAACSAPEDANVPDQNPDQGTTEVVADFIPGEYIVVLKNEALEVQSEDAFTARVDNLALELDVEMVLPLRIINGFSAKFDESKLASVEQDARVLYVEQDQWAYPTATQTNGTWGMDRIDSNDLNGTYVYNSTGAGVTAYVLDSGIRRSHNEFRGRVDTGVTAVQDGRGADDCSGHGTHVSGTIGGSVYGIAKNVRIFPVRVANCDGVGQLSRIIASINWVTNNHRKPAVANISMGTAASEAFDGAVNNSVRAGITYVVSAGNKNTDACSQSPARASSAITVGATDINDQRASFSNYGGCVDVFAPGFGIRSAGITSDSSGSTKSGTSMASPHVAGVVALILETNLNVTPATIQTYLKDTALNNRVGNAGPGSPNKLLYKGTR